MERKTSSSVAESDEPGTGTDSRAPAGTGTGAGNGIGAGLSIGAVAAQTHVSIAVLRAWEQRFGFPVPQRTAKGHRRYSVDHIAQVQQVLRDRDAGWSLEAAIERARDDATETAPRVESSIFAGLRRRRPDLPVYNLSRRTMLAISYAIEDEFCARAEHPVLLGSFQRAEIFRRTEARWRELARTAVLTVAFADFDKSRVRNGLPIEVALPEDASLLREWAVVCDAPEGAACLAGVERPARRPTDRGRMFEAVWSFEPAVVRAATEVGLVLARQYAPRAARVFEEAAMPVASDRFDTLQRASALTSRVVSYLEG